MIVWMCIWIAQNVRQSDALPPSPKEFQKCDLLSKNPALPVNIEFELEAILSIQVVFEIIAPSCYREFVLYRTELWSPAVLL